MSIIYLAFRVVEGLLSRLNRSRLAHRTPFVFFDYSLDVAPSFDANGQAIYPLAPLGAPVLRGSLSSSLFFSSLLANRQFKLLRLCHRWGRRCWTYVSRSIDRRPHRYVTSSSAYFKERMLINISESSRYRSRVVR